MVTNPDDGNSANYYDYWSNPKYYSVEFTPEPLSKSTKYTLTLPVGVSEQETATIIIYYKSEDFVDKSFGKFNFDFETIKSDTDVQSIRVAVDVQEGLYLKGGAAEVDYLPSAALGVATKEMAADQGVESDAIMRFSNQIEWQNGYVKTATALDPWESFHVKGAYARSRAALYLGRILLGIILTVAFIIGAVYATRRALKAKNKTAIVLITSAISSIVIIGTWFLAALVIRSMNYIIDYQFRQMLSMLIMMLAAIVILAALIAPPIYLGMRFKPLTGFLTLAETIGMMLVLAIIVVLILALAGTSGAIPGPYYY